MEQNIYFFIFCLELKLNINPIVIYSLVKLFVCYHFAREWGKDFRFCNFGFYISLGFFIFLNIRDLIFKILLQSESLERARFSRGLRMCAQAEQASDLRRRNQALVHNVLPPHVARYFLGARHHHRDLYSQSYAEVGVLFASMPNFSGQLIYIVFLLQDQLSSIICGKFSPVSVANIVTSYKILFFK